jgi:formate C-acetyltransferase
VELTTHGNNLGWSDAAMEHPEHYRNLTVRVAGYTAYFTELAPDLQNEIIARTSYIAAL